MQHYNNIICKEAVNISAKYNKFSPHKHGSS